MTSSQAEPLLRRNKGFLYFFPLIHYSLSSKSDMKSIVLCVLLLSGLSVCAQLSLERQVIANGGKTLTSGTLSQEFTLGEVSITAASSSVYLLTQGFQQGNPAPPTSIAPLLEAGAITLYPQPTRDALFIRLNTSYPTALQVDVYDMLGRTLLRDHSLLGPEEKTAQLPVSAWKSGTYYLRLKTATGEVVYQQKWVKW